MGEYIVVRTKMSLVFVKKLVIKDTTHCFLLVEYALQRLIIFHVSMENLQVLVTLAIIQMDNLLVYNVQLGNIKICQTAMFVLVVNLGCTTMFQGEVVHVTSALLENIQIIGTMQLDAPAACLGDIIHNMEQQVKMNVKVVNLVEPAVNLVKK